MTKLEGYIPKLIEWYNTNYEWYKNLDEFFDYYAKKLRKIQVIHDHPNYDSSNINYILKNFDYINGIKEKCKKFIDAVIEFYGEERVSVLPDFRLYHFGVIESDFTNLRSNTCVILPTSIDIHIHYPHYNLQVGDNSYPMKDMYVKLCLSINYDKHLDNRLNEVNVKLGKNIYGRRTTVNAVEFYKEFAHPHLNNNSKYDFVNFCKGGGDGDIERVLIGLQELEDFDTNGVIELCLNIESMLGYENTSSAYGSKRYKDVAVLVQAKPLGCDSFKFSSNYMKNVTIPTFYLREGQLIPVKDAVYEQFKLDLIKRKKLKGTLIIDGVAYSSETVPHLTKEPIKIDYTFRGKQVPFIVENSLHQNEEVQTSLNPLLENYVIKNIQLAAYRKAAADNNIKSSSPKTT